MDEDDGFGSFSLLDMENWTLDLDKPQKQTCVGLVGHKGRKRKKKQFKYDKPQDPTTYLVALLQSITRMIPFENKVLTMCKYLILLVLGRRNVKKEAVEPCKLTLIEKQVFLKIQQGLTDQERKDRVFAFMKQRGVTKRLINYFVVHYILVEREVSYYLDRRGSKGVIIGEMGNPFQQEIINLIQMGANIVWINLHQEYKTSKNRDGQRNLHTPYARSTSVQDNFSGGFSLCELNFYTWLEHVGGFEAFRMLEGHIRAEKIKYDFYKRSVKKLSGGTNKRRKIILKQTDGKNYRTFLLNGSVPLPYSPFPTSPNSDQKLELVSQPICKSRKPEKTSKKRNHISKPSKDVDDCDLPKLQTDV